MSIPETVRPNGAPPAKYPALRSVTALLSAQGRTAEAKHVREEGLEGLTLKQLVRARAELREAEELFLRENHPHTYGFRQTVDLPVWAVFLLIALTTGSVGVAVILLLMR